MSGRPRTLFRVARTMISDGRVGVGPFNSESWQSLRLLASAGCQEERSKVASMVNLEQQEPRGARPGPPSLAARGERRRIERRLQEVGVLCQPEVSLQYQTLAKRSEERRVGEEGRSRWAPYH